MKVGGNESATKYFQSHGGSAALASKDPKAKYTSNAATKYKEELQRRCTADAKLYVCLDHSMHTEADIWTPATLKR
jgi:ADP-ribosylation factor GTPase-activating protein 2/3